MSHFGTEVTSLATLAMLPQLTTTAVSVSLTYLPDEKR